MTEIVHVDLAAYPDAKLPARTLRAARCEAAACTKLGKPPFAVRLSPAGQGARPAGRREHDYPRIFDYAHVGGKASTDRVDALLLDHAGEVIGEGARVGGWPAWGQHCQGRFPTCAGCGEALVLAFEQPLDEELEHVMICPRACDGAGQLVVMLP